jgi:hypothetical protein
MTKIVAPSPRRVALSTALASLMFTSPIDRALADPPTASVIVVNPATNPGRTSSIDDPGRVAYQSGAQAPGPCKNACEVPFPIVPPGHRLVIQHVSGAVRYNSAPTIVVVDLRPALLKSPVMSPFFAPLIGIESSFNQPVLFYFDAGEIPLVTVGADVDSEFGAFVTLTGYLLDCTPAIPCAPIAPQ